MKRATVGTALGKSSMLNVTCVGDASDNVRPLSAESAPVLRSLAVSVICACGVAATPFV